MKNIDYRVHAFRISLYASLVSALIVLSFRNYFLFIPFSNGFNFLSFMGALSELGWILLIVVPPFLLSNSAAKWNTSRKWLFIAASSLWTVSTLVIKIYGLATTGQLWANYLLVYPALFFIEWILPAYYVWLAFKLAGAKTKSKAAPEAEDAEPAKLTYPSA